MHCSRRRLIRRGLEFHVCTINKSAHTEKSLETYLMMFVCTKVTNRSELSWVFFFIFTNVQHLQFTTSNIDKRVTPKVIPPILVQVGCPRGVMVKAMNCGIVIREFVLQSRYYVHFRANTLGKGMNLLILPPAMGKQQDGLGSSALVRQLVQEKENSEFKPVKFRLKIDLVSYPARAEGLVNSTSYLVQGELQQIQLE